MKQGRVSDVIHEIELLWTREAWRMSEHNTKSRKKKEKKKKETNSHACEQACTRWLSIVVIMCMCWCSSGSYQETGRDCCHQIKDAFLKFNSTYRQSMCTKKTTAIPTSATLSHSRVKSTLTCSFPLLSTTSKATTHHKHTHQQSNHSSLPWKVGRHSLSPLQPCVNTHSSSCKQKGSKKGNK